MKILLALIASIFVVAAGSAKADSAIYEITTETPMFVAEQIAYICNGDMNILDGVSCTMSIEHWSMDLVLPIGNVPMMQLEEIATLFCKVGEAIGSEPKITINGFRRPCGGIEV